MAILVLFGGISSEFGRSVPKSYENDLGRNDLFPFTAPTFGQLTMKFQPYQVSDLISLNIRTVNTAPDWLIANLGRINVHVRLISTEFLRLCKLVYFSLRIMKWT